MGNSLIEDICFLWQELAEFLKNTLDDKRSEYPFIQDESYCSLFMGKTILSLFSIAEQKEIQNEIKICVSFFKQRESKNHLLLKLNEDELSKLKVHLKLLQDVLMKGDKNIQFLVENQKKINQFVCEKKQEIDKKAGDILDEKLPRFLASTFEREVKQLKQQIFYKQILFFLAIIVIVLALLLNLKIDYFYTISVFFPSVWVLWLLSRQMNEDRKLLHEYKHKSVLARTYHLYTDQLERHSDRLFYDDGERYEYKELAYSFLEENIKSLTNNPTRLFNKADDNLPYTKVIEQLVKNLSTKK